MTIYFRNSDQRLSDSLRQAHSALAGERTTISEILLLLGEQGLLVACAIFAAPFLIPIALPFTSTVLGIPMILIALGVIMNRVAFIPARVLQWSLPTATLRKTLAIALKTAQRAERIVKPRWYWVTGSNAANAAHGVVLLIGVLLLMAPLPLVPFGNTFPAIAIILICLGLMERDGAAIALGYFVAVFAAAYLTAIFIGIYYAGSELSPYIQPLLEKVGIGRR